MKVVFASGHGGFVLKNKLVLYARELGYDVDDLGAHEQDVHDDYPDIVSKAAEVVSEDPEGTFGIILGGSGQGEAIVANRFPNVRAVVYYGKAGTQEDADGAKLSIVASTRKHNNANILSLGARFITEEEAEVVVKEWLSTEFGQEERHARRITKIEKYPK